MAHRICSNCELNLQGISDLMVIYSLTFDASSIIEAILLSLANLF